MRWLHRLVLEYKATQALARCVYGGGVLEGYQQ